MESGGLTRSLAESVGELVDSKRGLRGLYTLRIVIIEVREVYLIGPNLGSPDVGATPFPLAPNPNSAQPLMWALPPSPSAQP